MFNKSRNFSGPNEGCKSDLHLGRKGGELTNVGNYRPISILSVFSKILERILFDRIFNHLSENNILDNNQYGFKKNNSTEYAVLQLTRIITDPFEKSQFTLGIFIELSKAVDTIDHGILINKLEHYGITGIVVNKNLSWKNHIGNLNNKIAKNGTQISDVKSVATKFNEFFVNIGPNLASKIKHTPAHFLSYLSKSDKSLAFKKLTSKELDDSIKKLNKNKATGYDAISASIIKDCDELIKDVLLDIFNKSLKTGVFPDKMKVAIVTPIFKSGDESLVTNYRPISVLPVFSKILERIMYNRIFAFLYDNNLLYWNQYSFRSNYSTDHALMQLVEVISEASSHSKFTLL
ncbi:uncharacterized protein LOC124809339 [Hydra vulgaris]|uniref:uncharacterized protein LOC124809339 n=1 Tax=Hydra vulgaris TaxID=6087 RepID=UPI001F5F2F3A|nr:uncharacterized protein LOC124809339 [Hydra vulgaris]